MEIINNLLPTEVFVSNHDNGARYGVDGKEDKEVHYASSTQELNGNMLFVYNLQCKSWIFIYLFIELLI